MSSLKAALDYQARGWSLFPAHARSKRPYSALLPRVNNKPSWTPFQSTAPTRHAIETWFHIAPTANIMLVCGAVSGLVVLDFDTPDALRAATERGGWGTTPTVRGRRGIHAYFLHPGFPVRGGKNPLGIANLDVQGDGRTATAPPSVHESGYHYSWTTPPHCPLAPLPDWALTTLRKNYALRASDEQQHKENRVQQIVSANYAVPAGVSPYARKVLESTLDRLRGATHKRNDELNRAAYVLGGWIAGGSLDEPTVRGALESCALAIGLDAREIGPTIESGLRKGMAEPRVPPVSKYQPKREYSGYRRRAAL